MQRKQATKYFDNAKIPILYNYYTPMGETFPKTRYYAPQSSGSTLIVYQLDNLINKQDKHAKK